MKLRSVLMAAFFLTTSAMALDGQKLYNEKLCQTCHGEAGRKPTVPAYPKLNGQSYDYLVAQFNDIKSGKRSNGLTVVMKPMIQAVTDEQIAAIAKYLSEQK